MPAVLECGGDPVTLLYSEPGIFSALHLFGIFSEAVGRILTWAEKVLGVQHSS